MNHKLSSKLSPELEVYRQRIEATIKPYAKINLTSNQESSWWQSKFGGLPYMPKEFTYPKSHDDEYLRLLAQINFAEVPKLEGFPTEGIIQFYLASDFNYGLDPDNPLVQDKFRVIYFEKVLNNENKLVTDFSFLPPIANQYHLPFVGSCQIDFSLEYAPISPSDYGFDLFPLFDNAYQAIADECYQKFCNEQHQLGGYPEFTQADPRTQKDREEDFVLLLQICSEQNEAIRICWGDLGIANFFIRAEDLANKDFSRIWYNWDCS